MGGEEFFCSRCGLPDARLPKPRTMQGGAEGASLQAFPHRGEGGPKGRMRGRTEAAPKNAPSSVSLRLTASPLEGEALPAGRSGTGPYGGALNETGRGFGFSLRLAVLGTSL